jgi:hypothetical protein
MTGFFHQRYISANVAKVRSTPYVVLTSSEYSVQAVNTSYALNLWLQDKTRGWHHYFVPLCLLKSGPVKAKLSPPLFVSPIGFHHSGKTCRLSKWHDIQTKPSLSLSTSGLGLVCFGLVPSCFDFPAERLQHVTFTDLIVNICGISSPVT